MQQDGFRTQRARELRRAMTPTEKRLWSHLRGRRFTGFKFRRQTPIAGYIADFYCAQARLIIELDGESHVGREDHDENRRQAIEARGFKVLRVWDTEVYDEMDAVLELIWRECVLRGTPLTPDPSPPRGEGRKAEEPTDE
jgi:very-short-patch-repair endonuclease